MIPLALADLDRSQTRLRTDATTRLMTVAQIRREAEGVNSISLVPLSFSEVLPPWMPGAHVELVLPSGRTRHYSLCGDLHDRSRYVVSVLRNATGRGGSAEMHDAVREGDGIEIRGPFNNFHLVDAKRYLFIAGGIGITPILPMVAAVDGGADWQLVYGGRTRASMAFCERLTRYPSVRVRLLAEDVDGRPDLPALAAACCDDTVVYCCGPEPLLEAAQKACSARGLALHLERFAPASRTTADTEDDAIEVVLAKSGRTIQVAAGESILAAVRKVVPDVNFSCESGICGQCETRVIAGDIDHRDSLLSDAEKCEGRSMMICVSRARSGRLVLDL